MIRHQVANEFESRPRQSRTEGTGVLVTKDNVEGTIRVTSSRNQKSISMVTGIVPPDWLDKLESICGAKEEIDGVV
jgi:hypothetical protein